MARPSRGQHSRLGGLARMCVLAAVAASVAGCVGMPSNGPAQQITASPATAAPEVNLAAPHPSGPQPGGDPSQIVTGFLLASASYPTYPVAQEYLAAQAVKTWKPGWAVTVFKSLSMPYTISAKRAGQPAAQATVDVKGQVQASFNGSGQYVSAQLQGQAGGPYTFKLAKIDGQWRITNPPNYRMLTSSDFPLFYKAQDLYFFDSEDHVLVPDSVFVPLSATLPQQLDNLVSALIEGPKTPWLQGAADTELPAGTSLLGVTPAGSTVTVNLGGSVTRAATKLPLFAAQLVWTLTGSPASPPNITSVVLEINGLPWAPRNAACPGVRSLGPIQTQAAYECFDPYPSSPSSFYYVNHGQLWARCGSKQQALNGLVGSVVPVLGRTGPLSGQRCQYVHEGSTEPPPAQPQSLPALSMAAVSSDGQYLAAVTSGTDAVYVATVSGRAVSFPKTPRLPAGGGNITALSWDRNDDLWVVQGGNVVMLPPGKGQIPVTAPGSVTDLSIAPDGVRVAFIAQQAGLRPGLYLAAIGGSQEQSSSQLRPIVTHPSITNFASLGPGLTSPASLAWYDADDLVVSAGNTLWEVPADGQQAQPLPTAPPGMTSITADGSANVLVAGLSGGGMAVSTGLDGTWNPLGELGQNPVYPG
jgi:hypothetical protein